jgi:hypothetical protein
LLQLLAALLHVLLGRLLHTPLKASLWRLSLQAE